jgi:serine/threonine protein kinase
MTERPLVRRGTGQELERRRDRLPTPNPNRAILGRYEIQEVIQGINSNIYKAIDSQTNKTVAIKEVAMAHCSYAGSYKPLDLALREFKVGQNLEHDNLTAYHDCNFDEETGRVLLIRDWVDGNSLHDLINSGKKLSQEQIVQIMDCVLDATEYLHGQGVIHRDIKPANIIVELVDDQITNVKLIDLGAVSEQADKDQSSQLTTCIGTPGYMALEARTTPIAQSDLFSAGATLLYLICGKDADDILNSKKGKYIIPKDINGNFKTALQKTLQVAVEKRVQSAAELKEILHRGCEPTWKERNQPISLLSIRQIEEIISSDSFPALSAKRQEALMAACLEKFFTNKDTISEDSQKEAVLSRIASYPLSEGNVLEILHDGSLVGHFTSEQKAMMSSRITDEMSAEQLLNMETVRDCPEMEGILAARIDDSAKASLLLRRVVKGLGAQQILAERITEEKEASELLGLDPLDGSVVINNPGAQRILVSRISSGKISADLLEKGGITDPEAQKVLAENIDDEQLAGRMLYNKVVAANPEAEALLVNKITNQRYIQELLIRRSILSPSNQAIFIDGITDEEVAGKVLLSKAVCANPESERKLASKITRQDIAGPLLGKPCINDPEAQIDLAGKISDVRHAPKLNSLRSLCPQVQRDLVTRLAPPPRVDELISSLTDPEAQQIAAGKVEDSRQVFAILSSGIVRNNPGAQRILVEKVHNEVAAQGLLQSGNVTDPQAEVTLSSRIIRTNKVFHFLQNAIVKSPEAQRAMACRIVSPQSAINLLCNSNVWNGLDGSALAILVTAAKEYISENESLEWLLGPAKNPQVKEYLVQKIRSPEASEQLLMRGIFRDDPETEQYLARLIKTSAMAHGLLMSVDIWDITARSTLASRVQNPDHAYNLLVQGKAPEPEIQRILKGKIRSETKIQRLMQSGVLADSDT